MFQVLKSVKKVILTVFWQMKGPITIDFLEKGASINSTSYCQLLQHSPYLLNDLYNNIINNINRDIGPAVRVFANGPGDLGSIPGRVIPKTLKMVLDTTLLNTQHYKVRFKGKVEQSWEWSSALPYTLV